MTNEELAIEIRSLKERIAFMNEENIKFRRFVEDALENLDESNLSESLRKRIANQS